MPQYDGLRYGEVEELWNNFYFYRKLLISSILVLLLTTVFEDELKGALSEVYYSYLLLLSLAGILIFAVMSDSVKPFITERIFFSFCEIHKTHIKLIQEKKDVALKSKEYGKLKNECRYLYRKLEELIDRLSDPIGREYSERILSNSLELFSKKLYPTLIELESAHSGFLYEYLDEYANAFDVEDIQKLEKVNSQVSKEERAIEVKDTPDIFEKSLYVRVERIKEKIEPKYRERLSFNVPINLAISAIIVKLLILYVLNEPNSQYELAGIIGLTVLLVNQTRKKMKS